MKRIFAFIAWILALIVNFTSFAQPGKTTIHAVSGSNSVPETNNNKSLLWKITGKGLSKPSYLFGTIHQICKDDYLWTDIMSASFEKCEKVCFEMDMDDPALMTQVALGLMDKSGKTLKDYFTPEQYKHLKEYMKDSLGMEIGMYAQMKPVALQSIISMQDISCKNTISYEETLMGTAQKDNKEILGLEEAKEQLDVLETIPVDTVIKGLLEIINNSSHKDDAMFNKLVSAYKQQDLPALYKLITESKELGDGMDAFLDTRNKKWIPRMTEKMNKNSVFFAVGAGHLWGDNGVIHLLRKDGYVVEPVR